MNHTGTLDHFYITNIELLLVIIAACLLFKYRFKLTATAALLYVLFAVMPLLWPSGLVINSRLLSYARALFFLTLTIQIWKRAGKTGQCSKAE